VIRRSLLAATALAAALTLSSCATFSSQQNAASVNGAELTRDEFSSMLGSELGQTLLNDAPVNGFIAGNSARSLLGAWISINAIRQAGVGADTDTAEVEQALSEQYGSSWTTAPPVMQELAVDNAIIGQLLADGTITSEDLQAVVSDADATVDSRYGWWDRETFTVTPLG
jgi:hypothetical protein